MVQATGHPKQEVTTQEDTMLFDADRTQVKDEPEAEISRRRLRSSKETDQL
jgi:hypothetical protein